MSNSTDKKDKDETLLKDAVEVLKIEADAISVLAERIGVDFLKAVELIHQCRGKVVVTGMGKSGLVSKKIAATLSSTGTPSLFLHPAEGLHGDLGVLVRGDVVIAVSKYGETEEILRIVPLIRMLDMPLIALSGNRDSTLCRAADVFLDIGVEREACPWDLVPTSSTTAAMAMGDALAVALINKRGFQRDDFHIIHPAGSIGKVLSWYVKDLMHVGVDFPGVGEETPMQEVIREMSSKALGVTGVFDERGRLKGVITDGDLRRGIERFPDLVKRTAREVMTTTPKSIDKEALATDALNLMERYAITSLFVMDKCNCSEGHPVGIIHMHDILRAGVV